MPLRIDIVIPVYNEAAILPELFERLTAVFAENVEICWRVLCVNDGSTDASGSILWRQWERDSRFVCMALSRNFGHQAAITAGLDAADADAVVIMDADLQDPPELIPELIAAWQDGAKVVLAARRSRQESGLRRLGFDLFYRVFDLLSDYPVTRNAGVFGLLDRQAVTELRLLSERNRFLPGLRAWIGFEQKVVLYDRDERCGGPPKQTLFRLVRYAMDGIFSFSYKPLRLMTFCGLFFSLGGFLLALIFIVRRLAGVEIAPTGFTTLVTLILFLGGIQLIGMGVLGEYLLRIFDEVKNRPLYIVNNSAGLTDKEPSDNSA